MSAKHQTRKIPTLQRAVQALWLERLQMQRTILIARVVGASATGLLALALVLALAHAK